MANLTNSAKLIEEVEKKVNSSSLATVATSWSYADLSNKPTIPTVNDSTITVQKNGANVGSFTTNAATWKTINIQLTKADVWLGNVDNTSDANKPISTATQTALNNKQNKLIPSTGITINASNEISTTALPGTTKYGASLDLSIDDTTFVVTVQLKDQDGNNLWTAQTIDLPLESVVVSWSYDSATKKVILTLKDWSTVDFSVADLISWLQSEITSTNKLNADLVDDTNSAHKFVSATEKSTWNGKQDALTTAQLNAVNSWITSAKVSTYDWYATTIAWKQAALNSDQLAAVNSWITSTKVGTYDWYATSKQDKLTTQTAYSQKGSATKVPQITTNTLWQVTGITEVDIDAGETYNAGEWISIRDTTNSRKWPSPDGFHVPSIFEWDWLVTIMESLSLTTWNDLRINLHMPFVGCRDGYNTDLTFQWSRGCYWSSSPDEPNSPEYSYYLLIDSSNVLAGQWTRTVGFSVRSFKDSYVAPDSSWIVIQWTLWSTWIFWNQSEWLISVTDWTTGYTIMDKNLWATTVYSDWDTLTQANMGNMYQWWNNYWFPSTWTISKTSSTQVNASSYWPTNPYSSDTFITWSDDWSSVHNDDLWWDTTWTISQENVITNTGVLSVNWQTWNVTIQTGSEQNLFIITEDMVTVSTSEDTWVAPYSTSYKYTNFDINADAGIEWKEWAIYTFVVDTEMVVASAYRNVRVRIWDWAYIPVMATTAAASGSSYFAKTAIRQFQYTTKYESGWGLHVFTDSNTTYKAMTAAQATAWTATTALTISPSILKWAVETHAPVQSVNWSTWAVTVQSTISDLSTIRTNATNWATVVSGDSWKNYVIKVSTTAPASWTASNIITIVTD